MADDDIQGTVTDANGNAVSGAVVALWSQDAPDRVKTTTADSNGNYIFTGHPDSDGTSTNWHVAARDPNDGTRQFPSLHSVSVKLTLAQPSSGIARYKFEQDATDSWGSNDGTPNGGVSFSTNAHRGSYAASFDGTDDYIDNTGFGISNTGATIAFWAFPNTINYSRPSRVVYWGDGPPQMAVALDDGKWDAVYFDGSSKGLVAQPATVNTYTHVAYVWRDGQNAELYLNGSSVGSTSQSTSLSFAGTKNRIGLHGKGNGKHYDGLLDEVRYYNRGLTDTEVTNLYNSGTISG